MTTPLNNTSTARGEGTTIDEALAEFKLSSSMNSETLVPSTNTPKGAAPATSASGLSFAKVDKLQHVQQARALLDLKVLLGEVAETLRVLHRQVEDLNVSSGDFTVSREKTLSTIEDCSRRIDAAMTPVSAIPASAKSSNPNTGMNPRRPNPQLEDNVSFASLKNLEQSLTPKPPSAVVSNVAAPTSFATVLQGSIYFMLETILSRCQADRLAMYWYNQSSTELDLVTVAGLGMKRASMARQATKSGLVNSVFTTGVAANLDYVNLEDISECPGPTRGRNALFFPIRSTRKEHPVVGVVALVNHKKGTVAFTGDEERMLHELLPSVAYVSETYPANDVPWSFDPSPLHRLVPLQPYLTPSVALPPSYQAPSLQMVYHRNGSEKYVRRQILLDESTSLPDDNVSRHLKSVADYITSIETCWHSSITRNMDVERQVRQRQAHVADAREILQRKQRKLDVMKDALVEELRKNNAAAVLAKASHSVHQDTGKSGHRQSAARRESRHGGGDGSTSARSGTTRQSVVALPQGASSGIGPRRH